jgi:putative ABC transport system permease protein
LMGLAQAAGAIALCAAVVALCRWHAVRVEREAAVSMARGLVQMILVGMVLKGMEGALLLCFWSIAAGAGTVIAAMLATRSLRADISMLVPVGSMIIANAMNACAQAIERFRAEIVAHVGQIEAALSLGAEPAVTVAPYLQSAVYASLLPRLDMMKSLGLVWIPGVMAGMMVSGASPVYAGIYQFIIVAMILAASGIAGLVATVLMRSRVFSAAAQLALRPVS